MNGRGPPSFIPVPLKSGETLKSAAPLSDLRYHGVNEEELMTVLGS